MLPDNLRKILRFVAVSTDFKSSVHLFHQFQKIIQRSHLKSQIGILRYSYTMKEEQKIKNRENIQTVNNRLTKI